jgi:AcrR family transcriptional regulator
MPKIVDHDQRRRELAGAAVRVIARAGIAGASTRIVADEAGWSTGVLKHYFDGRDDLMRHALGELERRNLERLQAGTAADSGFAALVATVERILAADEDEWRVWIAFTSRAAVHPPTAAIMRRAIDVWTDRWAELLRRGQHAGSVRGDLDADAIAIEVHALVNGLRANAAFRGTRITDGADVVPMLLGALRPPLERAAERRDEPSSN